MTHTNHFSLVFFKLNRNKIRRRRSRRRRRKEGGG